MAPSRTKEETSFHLVLFSTIGMNQDERFPSQVSYYHGNWKHFQYDSYAYKVALYKAIGSTVIWKMVQNTMCDE
jgi:hypothetical protein